MPRAKKADTVKTSEEKQEWSSYDKDEVLNLVKKLEKEGNSQSRIGMILRDQYGISSVKKYGTKMSSLVTKKEIPEDLYNLLVRVVSLHSHMASNKKDSTSKHGLENLESKVRNLGKYYVRTGKLPKKWKYTIESARLLVK